METKPPTHPKHSNEQAHAKHTSTAPPTSLSAATVTASMFNNAQNISIAGGSFTITTDNTVNGLSALHKRVAPSAILNAGGRADEVRCHPGTREEVIDRIEKWRDAQHKMSPIFWLSGPAGAGKTAIVQTIAERCETQEIPQANFFFFRADLSRNSLSPLVATLVYQIIQLYPALCDSIATVLSTNPLILDTSLESQLTKLIVTPLQAFQQTSSSYRPPLLLIDGLDECEEKRSQQQILVTFDKILAKHHPCPFRLLVASRNEPQIQTAFNGISSRLLPLYLNDDYYPERDIRVFVNDKFKQIRKTHHLAHTLDAFWPSVKDIKDIVMKSSGQFIYAATVMRFILDSSASPALSLERVHGTAPVSTKSPFSYLDAIYTYILSQVDDQEELKDILHAQLLKQEFSEAMLQPNLAEILAAYNPKYTEAMLHSCLADLTPIAQYTEDFQLIFQHASFPDYLLDHSRSGNYFVDLDAFNFRVQPAIWKAYRRLAENTYSWFQMKEFAQQGLMQLSQLPPGFLDTLAVLDPSYFTSIPFSLFNFQDIFRKLYNLCSCDDDISKYRQILRKCISTLPFKNGFLNLNLKPGLDESQYTSFTRRYLAMTCVQLGFPTMTDPVGWIDTALRPETQFDIQETALWLHDLLHRIHREEYCSNVQEYNRLLQVWITWAVRNSVPLDQVDDLPNACQYLQL